MNLLHATNVVPHVSAYAYHHGQFNYDQMPLASMGCAVQFHIKPKWRASCGEHSEDGWYLQTSPEHYRCHIVFVKKTRHKRVSDTVYFKHKYITQPTITPANAVVKALQDLMHAIKGKCNNKGTAQFNAITHLQEAFSPGHQLVPESYIPKKTWVPEQAPRVKAEARPPRVQFDKRAPRTVVYNANPRAPMDHPRVEQQVPTLLPVKPKEPTLLIVTSAMPPPSTTSSIADRVKQRRAAAVQKPNAPADTSIANCVKAWRQEQIHMVVDMETGKLLEYPKLLSHPRFKDKWSVSPANEFGQLAQEIGR